MNSSIVKIAMLASVTALGAPATSGGLAWPSAAAQASTPWASVQRTDLARAIAAIEKAGGGKVLEIRFSYKPNAIGYDAVAGKGSTISHVHITATEPVKVVEVAERDWPSWMADWILKADLKSIQQATLPLSDAVATAERAAGAPAVDARIAKPLGGDNAVLAYDIQVIKDGRPQRIVIDAQTGSRIEDPDSLLDTWSPEEALYQSFRKK